MKNGHARRHDACALYNWGDKGRKKITMKGHASHKLYKEGKGNRTLI